MISAVFFDLGGTLLVLRRNLILSSILVAEGYAVTAEEVRNSYAVVEPRWLQEYSGRSAKAAEAIKAYDRLNALVIEHLGLTKNSDESTKLSMLARERWDQVSSTVPLQLYPDVEPVLSRLRALKITTALVSNAPADTVETVEALGLSRYLGHIIISGVVGCSKPNPEIFRIALARAAVTPEQTIHVGDVYAADVVGARNAGIRGILLDRGGISDATDCLVVRGLSDILPLVDQSQ